MMGRTRLSLSEEEFNRYAVYCVHDAELCLSIFKLLMDGWYRFDPYDRREPFGGQVVAVADDARERNLAGNPIFERMHTRWCWAWLRVFLRPRAWDERKRHAIHFGIFRIKHAIFIRRITAASQSSTNNLLA